MRQPFISEKFSGAIWRLEIDELQDIIFIEARNEAEKQVSFSSISLSDGSIFFKGLLTPERWLTGIEAAYDGIVLLHNYQSASSPLHKGLIAVDGQTGDTLWENYNIAFDHLTTYGPVLYDTRMHPKKLLLADIKTGATTRIYEPTIYPDLVNHITAPREIAPEALPQRMWAVAPYGNSVHYLEYNNFRIVSLHTLQAGQLWQYLYVIDGVDIVYEDLLNAGIQKMQPEAFIMHKNRLIYIKEKAELKVMSL